MQGAQLIREARLRAGLTQAALAARVGTTQSAIARLESGATRPSLERLSTILDACGVALEVRLRPAGDSDEVRQAMANLRLTVDDRLAQHRRAVRFIESGRKAMRDVSA